MTQFFKNLFGTKTIRQTNKRRTRLGVEALEDRRLLTVDLLGIASSQELVDLQITAVIEPSLQGSLPVLHSNPGMSKTLYLNFLGNTITEDFNARTFGVNRNFNGLVTHPFDIDGDASEFSGTEQTMIRKIWEIVSEDYAPFDIDVTTSYDGTFADGVATNVAIGGTTRDDELTSGYAQVGGFSNDQSNTAVVVTTNIANYMNNEWYDTIQAIGNSVSHESGHTFGLEHHHDLDKPEGSDDWVYANGTDVWTPIMGNNISTDRMTWSYATIGTTDSERQDQLQVLTEVIGLRADDHGDASDTATPMTDLNDGISFAQSGIIGTMQDQDVFSFRVHYSAQYQIRVDVAEFGNLDAQLTLSTADGVVQVIDHHIDDGVLGEKYEFSLEADTDYFVTVDNHNTYGDVGQYTLNVTWVVPEIGPIPEEPPIPFIPELDPTDPGDIWSNPEGDYQPEMVEPLATDYFSLIYDPASIWSGAEAAYAPESVIPLETDYLSAVYEPSSYALKQDTSWETYSTVAEEPLVTYQQATVSPVITTTAVTNAVFSSFNYSAFRAVSRFSYLR